MIESKSKVRADLIRREAPSMFLLHVPNNNAALVNVLIQRLNLFHY